ncbi:MAG: exodeoxyribonuclease V subunit gamma [Candidatus Dasytiphilus stammeri]
MFTVYHSNQLDILTKLITYYIKKIPLSDPLYCEYIMVPSNKMAQGLKITLAEQLDIVANIKFKLPTNFIWEIFLTLQPSLPKEIIFNKSHLTWKLMAILPEMLNKPEFEIFQRYLDSHQDKHKLFQLAKTLANIFDQYLVYRPDWLILWERNQLVKNLPWKTQKWQAPLWYALIKYTEKLGQPTWHIGNIYHQVIQKLQQTKKRPSGLPMRLFICGMTILPPIYITILYELSKYMDIHFMFTNPCRYYWGDIQHQYFRNNLDNLRIQDVYNLPKLVTQQQISRFTEKQFTNQILASWGKLGRDNLYLLSKIETQDIDAFVDIEANNLLHKIQHDILEMEDHTILGLTPENLSNSYNKRLLDPQDNSVRIHICYSKQRELEVLQDQLIEMLARDSSLKPSDIIVMVTNINIYAPFIQAVFGNPPSEYYYLPFTIYDRGACYAHPVIQAFLSLLRITEITYFSEEMLLILEVPSIAKKFNVNEDDLCYLRNCMYESGNQWILEDDKICNLPVGIRTKIMKFLLKLNKLSLWINKSRVVNEWKPLCQELLNDFFISDEDPDTEVVLNFIEVQWQHLLSNGISYYPEKIPITLLIEELVTQLDQIDLLPLSRSSIHFCSLIPSFYIPPVKVVCLLGMNDSLYPRILIPRTLNLMRHQPQCGDCNPRDEDRYFFLETLLSAQNQFYVSYVGRSVEDNKEILPSMLVSELIDYIAQNYCLQGTQILDVDTSAKLVREHLQCIHTIFDIERFISYSQKNEKIKAHQTQYLKTPIRKSVINEINISQLRRFWQHPARTFFNMRLGVKFDWIKQIFPNIDSVVDCFNSYHMNKKLLNSLIQGDDTKDVLLAKAKSSVKFPLGAFEELLWHKQQLAMKELAQRIRQYYCPGVNQEFNFTITGVRLHGLLSHVQSDGLVRWRPAPLNFSDGLVLWLEHLIYCFLNGAGNSRMFGKQNTQWHFMALSTKEATAWLTHFIQGYQSGISTPLLLLPKTGGAWLKSCFNEKTLSVSYDKDIQIKARQKLLQTWMGDQNRGENQDPYFKRLFRAMDESSIQKVIHHAKAWLLPLMLFNQKP